MSTNAFDYWKQRSGTGQRYVPVLDQNPANREWQIRAAASRLTPIASSMSTARQQPQQHSPTSPFASPTGSTLHSPSSTSAGAPALTNSESLEPDQLIAALNRSKTNSALFLSLRKKLTSKHPTDRWIDTFCKADGLHFLLEAWKSSREKAVQKLSDAYFQRECMESLKMAMQSPVIMDYVTEDVESQQKILTALDSTNVTVKKQAMDFLSCLCEHNQDGYQKALDIFERYKAEKTDNSRFQLLVEELRQAKTSAYKTTLITLINAVICNNELLRSRIRIRNEFLALKLLDILSYIRTDASIDDAELFVQLDTFDEQKFADDANLGSPDGLDLTNLMDVFHAILAQVSSTPQEAVFLTLLQHLLQVDPHESLGNVIWSTAEKLVHRACLLESKEDADLLLRPPVHIIKSDRLKSQVDLTSPVLHAVSLPSVDVLLPSASAAPSIPPPPPPPPPPGFMPAPPPPPPPFNLTNGNNAQTKTSTNFLPKTSTSSSITSDLSSSVFEDDPMPLPSQNVPKPKTRLKTFNWNKIPTKNVVGKNNIWTQKAPDFSNFNFDAMEEQFAAAQPEPTDKPVRDGSTDTVERRRKDSNEVNLFDPKRSLNVNIFLKQFRTAHETIIDFIRNGNFDEIGAEKLRGLLKILPESDEIDMLKSYEGNPARLGTAEKFVLQLIQVPNYKLRLEAMLFESEFDANIKYMKPDADAIIATARNIKSSTRLHETLHMVLIAGNFLNTGGYAGNAAGFKLSSLLKLADIRANKPTINLLHYVAEQAAITNPALLSFPDDLEGLSDASKISIENLVQDIRGLDSKCQRLIEQLEQADEEDKQHMVEFLQDAQLRIHDLNADLAEIEALRGEIAEFFCEDATTFRLEDCFKIFHNFCQKFRKAIQENDLRKQQEAKAENRRQEEEEKIKRRLAAGESIDNAIRAGQSRNGWSTTPTRRLSEKSGMLSSDEYASDTGTVIGTFPKRDTLESGYASDTAGAKKRARKMIRSSDEDDLMEYLAQGADATPRLTGRTVEVVPAFGRHSLRSRPGKSQDSAENRERSTSGATVQLMQSPAPVRQNHVEEWLKTSNGTNADPRNLPANTARPSSLPLKSPEVSVTSPSLNIAHPSFISGTQRPQVEVAKQMPVTPLRSQQANFQPNPIGYETTEVQRTLSPTVAPPLVVPKWNPLQEAKIQAIQQPRPWLPSKSLANAMHMFDPKTGCPGEPLGSGTTSPASSSSENVQPSGGRSGEETDTDTIKSGTDKSRKQLTATASQRLRKWRRLPATNGKSIDEEGGMTDTSIDDVPRMVLTSRNQQSEKRGKTLRELRESKRNGEELPGTVVKRATPPWSSAVNGRRALPISSGTRSPPKSETEEAVSPGHKVYLGTNVFDRLSAPKRSSPPLERAVMATVGPKRTTRNGLLTDDNLSDEAMSQVSKSHLSDSSSASSNQNTSQTSAKRVTLSSRSERTPVTRQTSGSSRPGDLALNGRTGGINKKNSDGSFTSKVSDYTLASPESPKVGKAALVLSTPVTNRFRL